MMNFADKPEQAASTQDWQLWLDELRELPPTNEVKGAIRSAEKILQNRRKENNAVAVVRRLGKRLDAWSGDDDLDRLPVCKNVRYAHRTQR